jgi:isorenieratene synthase
VVIGGGIAGMAAATGLAERGVHVTLVEPHEQLGGRVRSWAVDAPAGGVTMSRGFHAFFRQYYNLRALLGRIAPVETLLRPVRDYPVVRSTGERDSFARIPRTPPWSFAAFVLQSPTFTLRELSRVDVDRALSLLDVDFPSTFGDFDGVSAAQFLDSLNFPSRARHLALEVFARSFFADPADFSAGELVAMFHTYFLGSAEGLLFDVPVDDFDTTLWAPLARYLADAGVTRVVGSVAAITGTTSGARAGVVVHTTDGRAIDADAAVLAAGPRPTREIAAASTDVADSLWRERVARMRSAPPFAVWRLWLDRSVAASRPAFLGTTGYGPLDNVSVLERFEAGARRWSARNGGSVVEVHAYAWHGPTDRQAVTGALREALARAYPETRDAEIVFDELLVEDDCPLIDTGAWADRPTVSTGDRRIVLAGDAIRCDYPIALMERAATTGWLAANQLLAGWGLPGHELWTVPLRRRHGYPAVLRRLFSPGRSPSKTSSNLRSR